MLIIMKIIVKAVAGSHLFGLNTPSSDKDYKGVYMPSGREILLGNYSKSRKQSTNKTNERNTSSDEDVEFYSLDKFFRMLQEGQTVALELFFTPNEMILEKDLIWDEIIAMREHFLHKKVTNFIGYAQTQAAKYGLKGSRMNTLKNAISMLHAWENENPEIKKLDEIWEFIENFTKNHEHTSIMELPVNKNMQNQLKKHWEICGKKFDFTVKISYLKEILEKFYGEYGQRAIQAQNNENVDWKALSHALRVSIQGIELLSTGKITLPLKQEDRDLILPIKKGLVDYKTASGLIEEKLEELKKLEKTSSLKDQLKTEFIDDLIVDFYKREIT